MSASALSRYERAIRDILREDYQVEEIRFFPGGNHPRAEFDWRGKRIKLTLHKQYNGGDVPQSTLDLKRRDIRRLLGEPLPAAVKPKRTLDELTAEVNGAAPAAMPAPVPSTGGEEVPSVLGKVAAYQDGSRSSVRLRFFVPEEMISIFPVGVLIVRVNSCTWRLLPKADPRPRISRGQLDAGNATSLIEGLSVFGASPAEYHLDGPGVTVRLLTDQLRPVKEQPPKVSNDPREYPDQEKQTSLLNYTQEALDAVAAAVEKRIGPAQTPPDPRAVLRSIADIERAYPHLRLVRRKDAAGWAWSALITAEDE